MKSKRFLSLLLTVALVFTLLPVTARAATDYTIDMWGTYYLSSYAGDGTDTVNITINTEDPVKLCGNAGTTYNNVQIITCAGAKLTLENVHIDNSAYPTICALIIKGADNTLAILGENVLKGGSTQPGVKVETGAALTIEKGPGGGGVYSISAFGGNGGAGIGSGNGGDCGQITIKSGTIEAFGGNGGAGIGGGDYEGGHHGIISIDGGDVSAYGGGSETDHGGAGIGGGGGGDGGTITINGGTVTANGGSFAKLAGAGIGGGGGIAGVGGGNGGTITINNGTITAEGGHGVGKGGGAGIGGGYYGNGGLITINNGTITAKGGHGVGKGGGAGIGGGHSGDPISGMQGVGADITINGGNIKAYGGSGSTSGGGAGIGGGDGSYGANGAGGKVIINGGIVEAYGGGASTGGGAGIGGGNGGDSVVIGTGNYILITGGTVTARGGGSEYGGAGIGGGSGYNGISIQIGGGTVTAQGAGSIGGGAGIGGGNGGYGDLIYITGGSVKADGGTKAAGIGGGSNGNGPLRHLTSVSEIKITNGMVAANGGVGGAGIGGGYSKAAVGIFITGGSVNAVGGGGAYHIGHGEGYTGGEDCTPENLNGEKVYLTRVTLSGVNEKTLVESLNASASYYGRQNLYTDGNGRLYLYLPRSATTTWAITPDDRYMGNAVTSDVPTSFNFYTLTQTAEIVPASMTFDAAAFGYEEQPGQIFTVLNYGTFTLSDLYASIQGTGFEIIEGPDDAIAPLGTATVSVRPKTGLSAGTHTGTLTVSAINAVPLTAGLSFTVNAAAPSAPQNFSAMPGNGQVELIWAAPASDGGSPITEYEVSKDGGASWTDAASATGHTFTGLTNGTNYTFKVRAVNSVGSGAEASFTYTLQGPPPAPTIYGAIGGNGFVSLNWWAPASDGGATITSYQVKVSDSTWTDVGDVLTYTVTGLTNGTEYTLQVRAINGFGAGTAATVTATPRSKIGAPSAPQNFAATPGDSQVELNWLAPLDNGGSAITGYQVSNDNGTSWTDAGDVLTYTFTGLTNGTEYTLNVRAVSSAGAGAAVTVIATPQAASTDKTLVSVTAPITITGVANGTAKTASALGLPVRVMLVTDSGDVQADVTWDVDGCSYDPDDTAEQTFTVAGTVILPGGVVNTNGVSLNVTISVTVNAATATPTYIITASAGSGGSISPSGKVSAAEGDNRTFTITPDANYAIASVMVDGIDQGAISLYTFTNVTGDHAIRAIFQYTGGSDGNDSAYIFRTLTDGATGVTVSGSIHRRAALTVKDMALHPEGTCGACDEIRKAQKDNQLILCYDIDLTRGFRGSLTVSIPVGNRHNGQTVTILHCVNGRLETLTATVANGQATFTLTSLSPFAVTTGLLVPDSMVTDPPKTGGSTPPLGFIMLGFAAIFTVVVVGRRRKAYKV